MPNKDRVRNRKTADRGKLMDWRRKNTSGSRAGRRPISENLTSGLIGAITGIIVSFGAVMLQAHYSSEEEINRARREALLSTFTVVQGSGPQAFTDIETAFRQFGYLTLARGSTIKAHAGMLRDNPSCWNEMTEDCKEMMISVIAESRRELGVEEVKRDDLAVVMKPELDRIERALKSLGW